MLACAMNLSEGRDHALIAELAGAAGVDCLDVHADSDHHRSVLTLVGTNAPRIVAAAAVKRLDLRAHEGVHPRLGVVDVVPFSPLPATTTGLDEAVRARDDFGAWFAAHCGVPVFAYGPERTLPDVRRRAFRGELAPTWGPEAPHPSAGATCAGARPALVAYNVWLAETDLGLARRIAAAIRGPHVRALGFLVGDRAQVSCNLVSPHDMGPADVYDQVATFGQVRGGELVGLVPAAVLEAVDPVRWPELDLAADRTVEARLAARSRALGAGAP